MPVRFLTRPQPDLQSSCTRLWVCNQRETVGYVPFNGTYMVVSGHAVTAVQTETGKPKTE